MLFTLLPSVDYSISPHPRALSRNTVPNESSTHLTPTKKSTQDTFIGAFKVDEYKVDLYVLCGDGLRELLTRG